MGAAPEQQTKSVMQGKVTKIIFQRDAGFYILLASVDQQSHKFIGPSSEEIAVGDDIQILNPRKESTEKGTQYAVDGFIKNTATTSDVSARFVTPEYMSPVQMKEFLADNVEGVGDVLADRIVSRFGKKTHFVLTMQPEKLLEMEGIAQHLQSKITASYQHECKSYDLSGILKAENLPPQLIQEIVRRFGEKTISILRNNPFYFLHRVQGISFKECDALAKNIGMNAYSYRRVNASILYVFQSQTERYGHTLFSDDSIIGQSSKLLGFQTEQQKQKIQASMEYLLKSGDIVQRGGKLQYSLKSFAKDEKTIAESVARLRKGKEMLVGCNDPELGVSSLFGSGIGIVSLQSGYQKSQIYRDIVFYAQRIKKESFFCTLARKTSQTLSIATGINWRTLHSILKYNPVTAVEVSDTRHSWGFNESNPLKTGVYIIDDFNNVDTTLAAAFLSALPSDSEVILIGDAQQMPSVGPGQVFFDLLESAEIPSWKPIQTAPAAESLQLPENLRLLNIDPNVLSGGLVVEQIGLAIDSDMCEMLKKSVERHLDERSHQDIQILSCKYQGEHGVDTINSLMQELCCKDRRDEIQIGRHKWSVGDRVVSIKRLPELSMSKGATGSILKIDKTEKCVHVSIEGTEVRCAFKDAGEYFNLGYCMTPYSAQTITFDHVVLLLPQKDNFMLNRNLLTSVITRATKSVVLIGQESTIEQAINKQVTKRKTGLSMALLEANI